MSDPVRVLLVGQDLHNVGRRLNDFDDLVVLDTVGIGPPALRAAWELAPHIVVVLVGRQARWTLDNSVRDLTVGAPGWLVIVLLENATFELSSRAALAGARGVLAQSASGAELHDAILEVRQALADHPPSAPPGPPMAGRVVVVYSAKGGVGRTTLAANLALGLASATSAHVTLVDLNLDAGDVAFMFGVQPARTVVQALEDAVLDDDEVLTSHLTEGPQDLRILPAPVPKGAGTRVDAERIGRLLGRLAQLNHFVVVDAAAGFHDEITASILDAANLVLLVTTPAAQVLYHTQGLLARLHDMGFPDQRIELVMNRAGSKTGISTADAEASLDRPVSWRIGNDRAAMRALALGRPVILDQPRSRLARDISAIVDDLGDRPAPRRRAWRRWWRW